MFYCEGVLQTEHKAGLPFSSRYPSINLVCPSLSQSKITSQHLFLWKTAHQGIKEYYILRSLQLLFMLFHFISALFVNLFIIPLYIVK